MAAYGDELPSPVLSPQRSLALSLLDGLGNALGSLGIAPWNGPWNNGPGMPTCNGPDRTLGMALAWEGIGEGIGDGVGISCAKDPRAILGA